MNKPSDKKHVEHAPKKPLDLDEKVHIDEAFSAAIPEPLPPVLADEPEEAKPAKKAKVAPMDLGPLVWRVVEEKLININGAQTFAVVGQIFDANTCGVELIDNLRLIQKVKMEPVT